MDLVADAPVPPLTPGEDLEISRGVDVKQSLQTDAVALFGCALAADGVAVAVDAEGRTGVPGVWVAGTAAVPALLAVGAAGHAATVAVHVNNALIEQDLTEGRPAVFPIR